MAGCPACDPRRRTTLRATAQADDVQGAPTPAYEAFMRLGGSMRFSIILLAALSACAAVEPVPFTGPSGGKAYSMRCSGMGRTLDACYQKAGEVCPNGYTIVDRRSSVVASGGVAAPDYRLAVECK